MNILITGGQGFIGTNLCEYLKNKFGDKVKIYVIDNLQNDCLYNFSTYRQSLEYNISDIDIIWDYLKTIKWDYLIHLAAETDVRNSMKNPEYVLSENFNNTLKCLEFCRENNVKKMIFASSCGVVGEQNGIITEDVRPYPISPYALSKVMGEELCQMYSDQFRIHIDILRFSNVYGKYSNNKNSVIAKFIKQCIKGETLEVFGDGEQTRDFIHVDDVCKAIVQSLQLESSGVYNICTGENASINSLIEILNNHFDFIRVDHKRANPGEIKESKLSNWKMRFELMCKPERKLKESLPEIIEWFRNEM